MLQIGEFSRVCQVSIKTLHHYDKIGLLVPAEVDRFTGYRYYRTEQIDTMNYIQRLKRYGFSLEEIQHLITISDNKELAGALRRQKEKLRREQQEMAIILNELQAHISVFERTGDIMTYQKSYRIEVKNSPAMNVLAKRAMMGVDEFGKYYGMLFERVPKEHVTPTGLNGTRAWTDNPQDPQYAMSRACADALERQTDAKGRSFTIHKLPIPDKPVIVHGEDLEGYTFEEGEDVREAGERLAASYVNFYIANSSVVVPQFGDRNDEKAVRILAELFPNRKIRPIPARDILLGGGNIHCITQQIPSRKIR